MPYKSAESVISPHLPLRPGIGTLVDTHAPQVKTLFWTYFTVVLVTGVACYLLLEQTGNMTASLVVQTLAMLVTTICFSVRKALTPGPPRHLHAELARTFHVVFRDSA